MTNDMGQLWLTLQHRLRAATDWWTGELKALIPDVATRLQQPRVTLDIWTDGAALSLPARRGRPATRIAVDEADPAGTRQRLATAMHGKRNTGIVQLDASLLLETSVTLPRAAERTLRPILSHQLERLVPLPSSEVTFEYVVQPRSPGDTTITVLVIIIAKATIARALSLSLAVGLAPRQIVAKGSGAILWRATRHQGISQRESLTLHALEAAAVVLAIAAYGVYLHGLDSYRDELQVKVAEATRQTKSVRELSRQINQTSEALTVIRQRRRDPAPLTMLTALTQLVPENSWLTQVVVRGNAIEIVGFSPRVSDLVSRIDASTIFEQPRFRSPITLSRDGGGERFNLSFRVVREELP